MEIMDKRAQLIDGKAIAKAELEKLRPRVDALIARGLTPSLVVILVGDDPASAKYVSNKERKAKSLGFAGGAYRLPGETSEAELIEIVERLNRDEAVHGILVQLPLPAHIDSNRVLAHISPEKDVDGLCPENSGALLQNLDGIVPCTPRGIITLIKSTGVSIEGKRAVVVGRSRIVGRPTSMLLMNENATITVCHSHTENLGDVTREADILVVAVGHAGLVTADMIKPGAVVIDVGINSVDGKLTGDVRFSEAACVAAHITPVPGGVGPMTIAMLMYNTVDAAEKRAGK